MTDIGFGTKALDTGGVTPDDTDIVKHRGILQKIVIKLQLRMGLDDLVTTISHLTAVHKQYPPEFILRRIKLIYDFTIFHIKLRALSKQWYRPGGSSVLASR